MVSAPTKKTTKNAQRSPLRHLNKLAYALAPKKIDRRFVAFVSELARLLLLLEKKTSSLSIFLLDTLRRLVDSPYIGLMQ